MTDAFYRLGDTRGRALFNKRKGGQQQTAAHLLEPVIQLWSGLIRSDGSSFFENHIPGIHSVRHIHCGNAGLLVTVENAPLDRTRSAKTGQQRGVNVHTSLFRQVKDLLRKDFPISSYYDDLRLKRLKYGKRLAVF